MGDLEDGRRNECQPKNHPSGIARNKNEVSHTQIVVNAAHSFKALQSVPYPWLHRSTPGRARPAPFESTVIFARWRAGSSPQWGLPAYISNFEPCGYQTRRRVRSGHPLHTVLTSPVNTRPSCTVMAQPNGQACCAYFSRAAHSVDGGGSRVL